MDYIDEVIAWSKGGEEPLESPIMEALKKMLKIAPDKFIQQMQGLMEFREPKLMRSNSMITNDDIETIEVKYVGFKSNGDPGPVQGSEEPKEDQSAEGRDKE